VAADLTQHATVATTDDEDIFGIGVAMKRDVRDHLLIRVLVALCHLDDAVEHEDCAIC
jgi:hypothetical protein